MKTKICYVENAVKFDDDKLKLIDWPARTPETSIEVPGQARTLEAPREGRGRISLDWKEPLNGGAVPAYKIQRRVRRNRRSRP